MKNKKSLYLLLSMVLFIWGAVIYRVVGYSGDPPNIILDNQMKSEVISYPVADTFSLLGEYRDPFKLSKNDITLRPTGLNKKPPVPNVKKEVVKETQKLPEIKYLGSIINQDSKKTVALIMIDNHTLVMNPGETIKEIKLLKLFRDSIHIELNKQKLCYKK